MAGGLPRLAAWRRLTAGPRSLDTRIAAAAEAALAARGVVAPIDVLMRLGWLPQSGLDRWRQGRTGFLDEEISVGPPKLSTALRLLSRFSRSRRRYERQGLLVEEAALDRAETECLADADVRARRRARAEARRAAHDSELQATLARQIVRLFPGCPPQRAEAIARRTGERSSGRVGRSAAGRALDQEAVTLAVVASVRHEDTPYDELMMSGLARAAARDRVRPAVDAVLAAWRRAEA